MIGTACTHAGYSDAQLRYDHEAQQLVAIERCEDCHQEVREIERLDYVPCYLRDSTA